MPPDAIPAAIMALMAIPPAGSRRKGKDDVIVPALDGICIRYFLYIITLAASGHRAGTPLPASRHSPASETDQRRGGLGPTGIPQLRNERELRNLSRAIAGNTELPLPVIKRALLAVAAASKAFRTAAERAAPSAPTAPRSEAPAAFSRTLELSKFMILEHRGAVEAFLKAASIAEGRQPARKIMRRVLFYRADLHGAVTTASAGDLSAATFHSLRLADDLVMMMHVQDAILDGASSRHAACASHALSLLETLCVIAPSKVAGPFHRMAMHTLETHGSSGRLHECRGGRSQEEGGAGEREELTGLLNLSSSLHTRRTAAGSLGALLAAPDVERHTKPGLRRTLLLLVADHDPSVACRAALALSGEISALRGSGAAARQISGARKAWLRGEAWASLSEALRGEMPVPLLIASRLGAILTPDDVRERQKKPVPKGFGAQEDFFPADFADVLQAHVEWCIDSERAEIALSGITIVRAMCQSRALHHALLDDEKTAESLGAHITPVSADTLRNSDAVLSRLLRSTVSRVAPRRLAALSPPTMAVLLGAVLEALVWACDRDTDGQAVADLPTFEPVCQIHARKGSSVRQGPCANAAPATPRQAPLRPGQPRGVDAPTGLARPREVAAAVCESIEHLTLVITAARAADAAAPAPLPGHHSEPIALRQAVRAVLRALSDRLRWDKGFPLTGVDLALAVSPWVPSVAAEMLPGVLTAAWGSSATAAGRLWPLFSALNLSERPLTPRASSPILPEAIHASVQAALLALHGSLKSSAPSQPSRTPGSILRTTGTPSLPDDASPPRHADSIGGAAQGAQGSPRRSESVLEAARKRGAERRRARRGGEEAAAGSVLQLAMAEWAARRVPELAWEVLQAIQTEKQAAAKKKQPGESAENLEDLLSGEKGPDAARAAELRAMGQVVVRQCVHMLGHLTQAAPEPVQVVCGLGLATTAAFVDDETQRLCFGILSAAAGRTVMGEAAVSVRPGTRSLLTSALAGPLATLASIIESRKALSAAISCRGPSPHTWSQEGLQSVFERSFELRAQITAFMRFPQHLSASSSQFYPLGLTSKPFIDAWRVSQAGLPKGAPSVLSSRTDGAGSTHLTHRPRDLYRELEALEADADTVSCMVPATRAREGGARKDVQDDDGAGWGQAWVAVETDARADAAITRAGEGATEWQVREGALDMVVGGDSDDDQPDSGSPVSRSEDEGPGGGPSGSAKQELGVSRGKGTTPGRYDGYRDDLDWTRSDASVLEGGGEGTGDPTDPFADSDDDGFEVPVSVSVGPATGGPAHRHISSGSTKAPVTHHDDTVPGTSRDDEVADSLGDAGEDTAAEEASTPEGDVSEAPQQRSARSRSSRSRSDMSSGQSSTVFDCTLGQGMLSSVQVPSEEAGATAGGFGEGDGGSGRTGGGGAPGDEMYSAGQRGDEPYNTGREGGKGRRHVVWNDEGEKGQQDEGREVVRGETGRGETLVEGGEEDEAVLGIVGERKGENAGQSEDDVALGAREGDLEDADGLDGEEEADGTGRAFRSQSLSSVILHDEAEEEGSAEAQTIPRLTMINVDDGHGENKNGGSVAAAGGKMGWEERQEEVGGSQGGWRTRVKEDGEVEIEIDADDWDDFAEEDEGDEEMDGWGGDGEGGRGGQGETLGGDVAAEGGAGAALGEGGGGEDGEDEPFAGDGNQDANDEGGLSSPIRGGAIAKRRDDMSEEAGVTNEEGGLSRPIRGGAIANRKEKNEGGKSREEEAMFEGSDSGEDPFGETGNSGEWAFDIPDSGKEPEGAAEGPSDKRGTHGLEQLMLSRPSRMGTVGESMGGDDYGDGDELIGTLKTPRSRAGDSVVDPSRCPTCGSAYNGRSCLPKVLPCGHVQCEWCITDILKVAAGGGAVATCPRPGCSMVLGVAQQSAELTVELMPLSREALEAVGEQSGAGKGGLARDREGMGRDEEDDLDRQFEAGMEALQNLSVTGAIGRVGGQKDGTGGAGIREDDRDHSNFSDDLT